MSGSSRGLSFLCGSTWHTVALASIVLALPYSPTSQGGRILSAPSPREFTVLQAKGRAAQIRQQK